MAPPPPPTLSSPPDGVDALGAPEGAGRQHPRFGAARYRLPSVSGAGERDAPAQGKNAEGAVPIGTAPSVYRMIVQILTFTALPSGVRTM